MYIKQGSLILTEVNVMKLSKYNWIKISAWYLYI